MKQRVRLTTAGASQPVAVAFCITELATGGAERCLTELVTRLDRQRYRPTVYSLASRPEPPRDELVRRIEAAGVGLVFLDARRGYDFPRIERRLRQELRQNPPRILQTFLFHANLVGRLASWRAGVPHIVAGVRVAEPRRWHTRIDAASSRIVERYVCVSQAVADFTAGQGIDQAKLLVIPNGIDLQRFEDQSPPAPTDLPPGRHIVYVGRLERQKRVDWLLQRGVEFLAKLPEHSLLIVGDGSERARLEQLAQKLGLGSRVRFLGFRADSLAVMQASELLVLTSAWEGMPNVVLEAMACGKPVVCTAAEGVTEIVGPLADRQVVALDAERDFEQRVIELASNPSWQASLGSENLQRVREHFSIERMVARYEQLYDQLLEAESPEAR